MEQELLTLPKHLNSTPVVSGVRVARPFIFSVMFGIVVCHFVLFRLVIVLYVLSRFTVSDYPFGIFTLFSTAPVYFILSSSKELTSWVKLQVQIFCKARRDLPYKRFLLAA
jgi:hypothetical protein